MAEVGALLGVHTSTVSRIESGERRYALLTRDPYQVADRLGVTPGYLLRSCPQCAYSPPSGYQCLRCGTASEIGSAVTLPNPPTCPLSGAESYHIRPEAEP